ncbi:MAG: Asp-tRNA(Asn)/Glu-tRNA(Gln) amidotransferase GatCAB subunit A, partial [Candidatus Thioglobus sp.]
MHNKTIAQLSQGLNSGEFSSVELTQHYLDRINASDLNAFITVTNELAMKQAQAAD